MNYNRDKKIIPQIILQTLIDKKIYPYQLCSFNESKIHEPTYCVFDPNINNAVRLTKNDIIKILSDMTSAEKYWQKDTVKYFEMILNNSL